MKGILLAAGRGRRLQPLTDTVPKPLLAIGGRPLIDWIIMGLRSAGIDDLAIVTGHLAHQIEEHLADGSRLGVTIQCFRQAVRDGTARAVLPAEEFLRGEPFFLGYGDILVESANYRRLMDAFWRNTMDSVLGVRRVPDPSAGGAVIVENGRVAGLVEKPAPGTAPSDLINAGLMILQPRILEHIHRLKPSPRGEYELTDAMLSLARETPMHVVELTGYWSDVGTPDKLQDADDWIRRQKKDRG